MHTLRRMPQPLPCLRKHWRPCLWRNLSWTVGRGARSGFGWASEDVSPSQRDQLLRPLRIRMPGQNPAHPDHASLAQRCVRQRNTVAYVRPWIEIVGCGGAPAEALLNGGQSRCGRHAPHCWKTYPSPLASDPIGLVHCARSRPARTREFSDTVAQTARKAMSTARDTILQSIAKAQTMERPVPAWSLPSWTEDAAASFIVKAKRSLEQIA